MIPVLVLAVSVWFLGRWMQVAPRDRWLMIGLLYVAVLALLVVLPEGHPLQQFLGGTLGEWLVIGLLAALVWAYQKGLGWLRSRATPPEPTETRPQEALQSGEIERYARHITLREIGGVGQKRLKEARVLVIGAGGLGSPACLYLAAAGVGTIGVIDDDVVELPNLQRQIAHSDARTGQAKVFSAEAAMLALNPTVKVRPYKRRFTEEIASDLVADYDIVLDGSDNFETRYLSNRVCVAAGKPLVLAALSQWEGQISVFDSARGGPCYACIFPEAPAPGLAPSCAEAGVVGPLTGVVGSMMAVEAVKLITEAGDPLVGRMLIYDALYGETRVITLDKRADCAVCGT
jgi:molybdopterin/thiamine biosynthesis adenylyltransferase